MMKKENRLPSGSGCMRVWLFLYSLYLREYALLVT
ncbi:hypothetical protein QO009_003649 [Brevibacillus aydinogluensis]|jgi:hypothetical protein|uniref:Uncharacterized protein n=1 Tax=Brevibacillus aydinogluensis TaxID=927786 RepID=A0AA48M4P2_9BACL|nr:hypothetical protein [Brevibacillus aydinogluensis]CAJ1001198.1 hypothetical protein BSPP4475_02535 [Brevibacillus aydinogluensis]